MEFTDFIYTSLDYSSRFDVLCIGMLQKHGEIGRMHACRYGMQTYIQSIIIVRRSTHDFINNNILLPVT